MNFLVLVPKPHFPQMLFKDMSVFAEHKAEGFLLSALLSVFGESAGPLAVARQDGCRGRNGIAICVIVRIFARARVLTERSWHGRTIVTLTMV